MPVREEVYDGPGEVYAPPEVVQQPEIMEGMMGTTALDLLARTLMNRPVQAFDGNVPYLGSGLSMQNTPFMQEMSLQGIVHGAADVFASAMEGDVVGAVMKGLIFARQAMLGYGGGLGQGFPAGPAPAEQGGLFGLGQAVAGGMQADGHMSGRPMTPGEMVSSWLIQSTGNFLNKLEGVGRGEVSLGEALDASPAKQMLRFFGEATLGRGPAFTAAGIK